MEGLTISCIIGMYLNLLSEREGRDLIGVHKLAQLQSIYVAVKPGLRLNPFLQVKLVIFILPRLNMHLDELRKLVWSLN